MSHPPRLAVPGAGPIGLEAALAAGQRGLDFTVFEAGDAAGGHVRQRCHVFGSPLPSMAGVSCA